MLPLDFVNILWINFLKNLNKRKSTLGNIFSNCYFTFPKLANESAGFCKKKFFAIWGADMRWAGTARYADSPRWGGFHLTVIWNSLSCFKKFFVQSLFTFIAVAMVLFVLTILKSNLERTLKHIYVHSYLALLFFLVEKAHLRVFIWTIFIPPR